MRLKGLAIASGLIVVAGYCQAAEVVKCCAPDSTVERLEGDTTGDGARAAKTLNAKTDVRVDKNGDKYTVTTRPVETSKTILRDQTVVCPQPESIKPELDRMAKALETMAFVQVLTLALTAGGVLFTVLILKD